MRRVMTAAVVASAVGAALFGSTVAAQLPHAVDEARVNAVVDARLHQVLQGLLAAQNKTAQR